ITTMLGIPAGDKIRQQVRIPEWVYSSPAYLIPCLRGLFETDGCFAVREVDHVYFTEFTNHNVSLLDDCQRALEMLGFHPQRGSRYVRLAQTQEIRLFCRITGFLKADLSRIPTHDKRLERSGEYHECGLPGCTRSAYRRPSAETKSGEWFCSPEHAS